MAMYYTLLLFAITLGMAVAELPLEVATPTGFTKLRSQGNCSLYRIEAQTDYDNPPLLIHLTGSRYDIGYGYGYLLAKEIAENYESLLKNLLGDHWYDEELIEIVGLALDWQWTDYLSKELPEEYKTELKGLTDGGRDVGCIDCGKYATRAIVLANAPGDLQDFIYILMREFDGTIADKLNKRPFSLESPRGLQCSMYAVWGSRTEGKSLYSARNLDWNKDTGVNKYKVAMIVVPDDGGIPSATLGFACLYGTLAGMSAKGLTVHEANLEENEITFGGFPWTLRLRYIMEYASNLQEGKKLWAATNNTVGFNHMIASGPDAIGYSQGTSTGPAAYALETMYLYTAYFPDNDPREANAMYNDSGTTVHIGFPMEEAVWRTNHGYDPVIREHYEWSQSPTSWSMQRYMFIHDALTTYHTLNKPIGFKEAINITAIAGDKGKDPYICQDNTNGTNVLSVTFAPNDETLYVAWERSTGVNWRPATCSTYLKLELKEWFTYKPPY